MKLSQYLLIACLATGTAHAQAPEPVRPNIIYIFADDLGYAETGPYGQEKIKTPNLDRLAAEGMRFTQHYAGAPVCAPSRCMLLTGKHSGHSYIRGNYELGGFADSLEAGQMPLPEGTYTLPRMLKAAGYATGMMGKWGLGMHNTTGSPTRQGFDYYFGYLDQKQAHNFYPSHLWENDRPVELDNPLIQVHQPLDSLTATPADFDYFRGNVYAPDLMTEKALAFMEKNRSAPFFLYLPYTLPHVSLQAPDAYVTPYRDAFGDRPYYGQKGYASTQHPRATYAAMITYLDAQVGLVMEQIKRLGLDSNTLILFSSDNGTTFNGGVDPVFFNSVGGLRGLKMDLYEGGIRVPFLVRWPGKVLAGTVSAHISAQFDVMPTLAELTGQHAGETDGISFLPTLLGRGDQRQHPFLYFEYPEKGGQLAVRMGNWKGVKVQVRKLGKEARWQLFDLQADPGETTDVAAQHPELVRELERIVKQAHRPSHIREWEFVDPKFAQK